MEKRAMGQIIMIWRYPRSPREVLTHIIQLLRVTQKMSHEDVSPNSLPSQKSMSELKTTNSIRKITIQTLSPIVGKLEQHISYILEQTAKLRAESAKLTIASANQQALQRQFDDLSQNFDKLSAKVNAISKDMNSKMKERESETRKLAEQLQYLKKEAQVQGRQIEEIANKNEECLALIEQNKAEQLYSIEQLQAKIENYNQQGLIRMESLREELEQTKHGVAQLDEKRKADQEKIRQITKITSLYEAERGDFNKNIERTTELENSVVMLADYEKDRELQRANNEQTKNEIQEMLDEALTPEIRRFLPKLISRLNDLEQFQATLTEIQIKLKQGKKDQDERMQEMTDVWNSRFDAHQKTNSKAFDEVNKKMNINLQVLEQKIEINEQKVNERLRSVEEQLRQLQKRWKTNLNSSISKLDADLRQYLNVWGEQFLDRKKDNIYQLVQTQKPPEQHQEQHRVQQLVYSMEPLLNAVKEQLKTAQSQVQSSKQTLYERLSFFNNQIVKMKSDITRETTQTKRVLDTFTFKLLENKDTCDNLSLLLSKIVQTTAISYALSLDQSFLHREHEVYVTYNDGILLEVSDKGCINYRRHEYVPELLKRAVLTQLVKIIDSSIVDKPLLNWNKNQFKPSHLAPSIQGSYQTLLSQNKISPVPLSKNTPQRPQIIQRKSLDSKLLSKKQPQSHHVNKLSPNQEIFSKTIDPDGHDFRTFNSATRYDIGYEENRQYTSRRKNIKLKKIDKKEH